MAPLQWNSPPVVTLAAPSFPTPFGNRARGKRRKMDRSPKGERSGERESTRRARETPFRHHSNSHSAPCHAVVPGSPKPREGGSRRRIHSRLPPCHAVASRRRILWLIMGKTNVEIGLILGLAANTIKKHLTIIFGKQGVEHRTAAALYAREFFPDG
jgi:DNA-binding CsgD family transcriptional regulator